MGAKKPDGFWDSIRIEYENSDKTIYRLSKEYGITENGIKRKAKKDQWVKYDVKKNNTKIKDTEQKIQNTEQNKRAENNAHILNNKNIYDESTEQNTEQKEILNTKNISNTDIIRYKINKILQSADYEYNLEKLMMGYTEKIAKNIPLKPKEIEEMELISFAIKTHKTLKEAEKMTSDELSEWIWERNFDLKRKLQRV